MPAPRKPLAVTAERVAELLDLDPGAEFGWRHRRRSLKEFSGDERAQAAWNNRYAGRPAGSRQTDGRPVIQIDGRTYGAERLIEELGEAVAAIMDRPDWFCWLHTSQRSAAGRRRDSISRRRRRRQKATAGEPLDLAAYGMLTGHLGRALRILGLKREPRDVTPTLEQYLAARRAQDQASEDAEE
jgi:hypothetical protein